MKLVVLNKIHRLACIFYLAVFVLFFVVLFFLTEQQQHRTWTETDRSGVDCGIRMQMKQMRSE